MTPFDPRLPIIAADARVKTCHVLHCWLAMREMGKRFHAGAFAQFAGLEDRHVADIIAALEAHDALPDKRSPTTQRGTRLPDDWEAPADWIDWAVEQRHWEPAVAREESESFADYWQSRPGQGGTKLDWRKTWQNWVRNSRRPDGDYRPPSGPIVSSRDHMERTAALYERMGRTAEAADIRRTLDSTSSNVLPFNPPTDSENRLVRRFGGG